MLEDEVGKNIYIYIFIFIFIYILKINCVGSYIPIMAKYWFLPQPKKKKKRFLDIIIDLYTSNFYYNSVTKFNSSFNTSHITGIKKIPNRYLLFIM
jgi:hypothetical protein